MLRTLLFFAKLAVLVYVAWWLALQPGEVTLEWLGYRVDTSVGVLLFITFIFGILAALAYRFWGSLWRVPGQLGRVFERSRERRGYRALSQGMVAVAAGDAEEAQRWARKASSLLEDPPLTMLLSAQAAQLEGDEQAAKRYFEAMLKIEDLRFLGLRGLMMQALRQGDDAAALDYARQAKRLRPNSAWVLETLFELSEKAGDLEGAQAAIKDAAKTKALPAADSKRRRAVLLVEQAEAARNKRQREPAIKMVKEARKLAPDLVPATLLLAELHVDNGRRRDAVKLLERAWADGPHPRLVAAYRKIKAQSKPIEGLQEISRLVASRPEHPESRLALAEAAFEAELWGETRRYLAKIIEAEDDATPGERVCRLMARLEEAEHEDVAKARSWLLRAADAPAEPAWVCESCGTVADDWSARCGACNSFDSLRWSRPPRVSAPTLATDGGALIETLEAERGSAPAPVSKPPAETPAVAVPAAGLQAGAGGVSATVPAAASGAASTSVVESSSSR